MKRKRVEGHIVELDNTIKEVIISFGSPKKITCLDTNLFLNQG